MVFVENCQTPAQHNSETKDHCLEMSDDEQKLVIDESDYEPNDQTVDSENLTCYKSFSQQQTRNDDGICGATADSKSRSDALPARALNNNLALNSLICTSLVKRIDWVRPMKHAQKSVTRGPSHDNVACNFTCNDNSSDCFGDLSKNMEEGGKSRKTRSSVKNKPHSLPQISSRGKNVCNSSNKVGQESNVPKVGKSTVENSVSDGSKTINKNVSRSVPVILPLIHRHPTPLVASNRADGGGTNSRVVYLTRRRSRVGTKCHAKMLPELREALLKTKSVIGDQKSKSGKNKLIQTTGVWLSKKTPLNLTNNVFRKEKQAKVNTFQPFSRHGSNNRLRKNPKKKLPADCLTDDSAKSLAKVAEVSSVAPSSSCRQDSLGIQPSKRPKNFRPKYIDLVYSGNESSGSEIVKVRPRKQAQPLRISSDSDSSFELGTKIPRKQARPLRISSDSSDSSCELESEIPNVKDKFNSSSLLPLSTSQNLTENLTISRTNKYDVHASINSCSSSRKSSMCLPSNTGSSGSSRTYAGLFKGQKAANASQVVQDKEKECRNEISVGQDASAGRNHWRNDSHPTKPSAKMSTNTSVSWNGKSFVRNESNHENSRSTGGLPFTKSTCLEVCRKSDEEFGETNKRVGTRSLGSSSRRGCESLVSELPKSNGGTARSGARVRRRRRRSGGGGARGKQPAINWRIGKCFEPNNDQQVGTTSKRVNSKASPNFVSITQSTPSLSKCSPSSSQTNHQEQASQVVNRRKNRKSLYNLLMTSSMVRSRISTCAMCNNRKVKTFLKSALLCKNKKFNDGAKM